MRIGLILDNIRSASNIGSLFRTCDSFAIDHLYLCGICATPPNREILKTALGATETVSWSYHENIDTLLLSLKNKDSSIIAIEQADNSVHLESIKIEHKEHVYLILGNEVEGVSNDALKVSDMIAEIPQFGSKKSLNVSVAGGIALWHFDQQRRLPTK